MDSRRVDLPSLPEDAAALRVLVLATLAERDAAVSERDTLLAQNDRLRHLLLKLTRMQFGAKSERLPEEQMQLGLEALEQAIAKDAAEAEKRDPGLRKDNATRRRAGRGALPAHLPRIEVTLVPDDTACPCCRTPMTVIGEDSSERLDVIPVQYRVIVTKRPKFACRACVGTVVQAPAPARLIEGGIPTEALVAQVAVARFADHQPLYRQAQMMARQGVIVDRSTLSFWIGYAAAEIAPVVARLREMMLASTRIFADETVVPVLDPGAGGRSTAISGRLDVTTARGVAVSHLLSSIATHPVEGMPMPRRYSVAIAVSCNAMAIRPTRRSLIPRLQSLP